MSDIALSSFRSRRSQMDKERALNAARNPGDSKYGTALYKNNAVEDRTHSAEVGRIENQLKRASMHMDQQRKQFLQQHTLKEPMLIVVRPPSPGAIEKYESRLYNIENDFEYGHPLHRGGPRYMQPLDSKNRIPNYRPTIDAFCLQTKKKVNVWEHVLLEKETPRFRSTVMPSYPLSAPEIRDLIKGLEYHKLEIESGAKRRTNKTKKKSKKRKPALLARKQGILPDPPNRRRENQDHLEDAPSDQWHFVTETPTESMHEQSEQRNNQDESQVNANSTLSPNGHTVTFKLPSLKTQPSPSDEASGTVTNLTTPVYSSSKDDNGNSNGQWAITRNANSNAKATVNRRKSNAGSNGRNTSTSGQSKSASSVVYKTTAICVVHGETEETHSNIDDVTNNVIVEHDSQKPVTLHESRKEAKEEVMKVGTNAAKYNPDQLPANNSVDADHLTTDKEDPSEQKTKNRRRSGLSIILEAALEGMNEARSNDQNV